MLIGLSLIAWYFSLLWLNLAVSVLGIAGLIKQSWAEKIVKAWLYIGEKIGWVNSRIILSFIFFILLSPLAFFYRLSKKNPLQLKKLADGESYYITRNKTFVQKDFERPF